MEVQGTATTKWQLLNIDEIKGLRKAEGATVMCV